MKNKDTCNMSNDIVSSWSYVDLVLESLTNSLSRVDRQNNKGQFQSQVNITGLADYNGLECLFGDICNDQRDGKKTPKPLYIT